MAADQPSALSERQFDAIGRELHPDRGLVTPGRTLYARWLDSPAGSNRENEYLLMNRAEQELWENLAVALEAERCGHRRCIASSEPGSPVICEGCGETVDHG